MTLTQFNNNLEKCNKNTFLGSCDFKKKKSGNQKKA